MKGQYRVIAEILLFVIGLVIANYILISFAGIQDSVGKITLVDNFGSVGNKITAALVKVSLYENATMTVQIPRKISDRNYVISLRNNELTVHDMEDPEIYTKQQIFNISQGHTIVNTDIASSVGYVNVTNNENIITLKRA